MNGKVWPFLDVEPRLYRFRVLNGCNARFLALDFGSVPVVQIGAEGGLFDVPVPMGQVVLGPAERADLKNRRLSRPMSSPAPTLVPVMQFRVA